MTVRPPRSLAPAPVPSALDAIQYEVLQEKASTLSRATQSFEKALAAFLEFDAAPGDGAGPGPSARREALLDAAGDALWRFVVQRESCGLRNTEAVLREYRVPAVVRLRMGVARGGRARPDR